MEKNQEREWTKAQSIEVSVDLINAAKNQLKFLAAVDRNRYLYDGPALERAIYRYNAFWLPLLDKHTKNPISEDPLMVPLDCEWIWHCHRLNPLRYKSDCEKLFGRILGNNSIISSVNGTLKSKSEEIWKKMYPHEPYELEYNRYFIGDVSQDKFQSEKYTSYDLVSAVKRQVTFFYQVSRPHVSDDLFLQEALARYKGFLYLNKMNCRKKIKNFFVPTYDVDLLWHSHQLHPISYCNDLCKLFGKVMGHDDTTTDRTKGNKLDIGFSGTTKMWEDTFGLRYWKAGAMYRGTTPTPVVQTPLPYTYEGSKKFQALDNNNRFIQIQDMKAIEILLEFVEIKNLPEGYKEDLRVAFSKRHPDRLFDAKKSLTILSESGQKQVDIFQCEPTGEFLFELVCDSASNVPLLNSFKNIGFCSLSLQECIAPKSKLSIDKWVQIIPVPGIITSKPILLHVSLSFTPPMLAPHIFRMMWSLPALNSLSSSPISIVEKVKHTKARTCATNEDGNDTFCLQMRHLSNDITRSNTMSLKEVQYITKSGETHTVAEFNGNNWSIKGTNCSSTLHKTTESDHLFELVGHQLVRLFAGRKLYYEQKHHEDEQSEEQNYMTAVEFSVDYPYGRAIGLFDFRNGLLKVNDEGMISTSITLAFIISDMLKRKGGFVAKVNHLDNMQNHVKSPHTIEAQVANGNETYATHDISKSGVYRNERADQCVDILNNGGCGLPCVETWMSFYSLDYRSQYKDIADNEGYGSKCADCSTGGGGGNCGPECGPIMEDSSDHECGVDCFSGGDSMCFKARCLTNLDYSLDYGNPSKDIIDNKGYGSLDSSECGVDCFSGGDSMCIKARCLTNLDYSLDYGNPSKDIIDNKGYGSKCADCSTGGGGGNCGPECGPIMEDSS